MSCCCDTYESGLYGLSGLNGLMGALLAPGSRVRVGFAYNYHHGYDVDETEAMGVDYIQGALRNYLEDGVVFKDVNVAVQPPAYFDYKDGYITVEATSMHQLPDPAVFGDMVEYGIQQYLPRLVIVRRDETVVDFVSSAARGKSGVAQPTPTQQQRQQQNQLPSAPNKCPWSQMQFGEWVACQLGISSAVGGVAAGATGALVGVGVLTLLAVVLLKR